MEKSHCSNCETLCEKICSNCKKVSYCSVQCQKIHRTRHRPDCYPAFEKSSREKGRHLVATRDIEAGSILWAENDPLIVAPAPSGTPKQINAVCLGCCTKLKGDLFTCEQTCRKCKWPICGPKCTEMKLHTDFECKIFQEKQLFPIKFLNQSDKHIYDHIKLIRCILLEKVDTEKWKKLCTLESNISRILGDPLVVRLLIQLYQFVTMTCGLKVSKDMFDKYYGIIETNSNEEADESTIGIGLRFPSYVFDKASKLIHDCISNTQNVTMLSKSGREETVVMSTIPISKGDILTQCYGDNKAFFLDIVERRAKLYRLYHFWCTCKRCSDPSELGTNASAVRCFKAPYCGGYYLPLNSLDPNSMWKCVCPGCNEKYKYEIIGAVAANFKAEIASCGSSLEKKLAVHKKYATSRLDPNHIALQKEAYKLLRQLLLKNSFEKSPAEKAKILDAIEQLALKLLKIAEKLKPGLSTLRGILLFYLSQATFKMTENYRTPQEFLDDYTFNTAIREEAKAILKCMLHTSEGGLFYAILQNQDNHFSDKIDAMYKELESLSLNVKT